MSRLLVFALCVLPVSCQGLRFAEDGPTGVLEVRDANGIVFAYRYVDQSHDGVPAALNRASYVHPIVGLDGVARTADFPEDHRHHRGLSLMWPHVHIGDEEFDLWHLRGVRTVFVQWLERRIEAARAYLGVENAWQLDDGTRVCREHVQFVVHPASDGGRAIDVAYTLTALREAIRIRGQDNANKGYGGLVLRFVGKEQRTQTVITTETGRQRDRDRQRFAWADFSARFHGADAASGIAVFPDPGHPDGTPPWTLRHYGMLNVAWPGRQDFTLRPGVPLMLRYRLWIHRGDARRGRVADAYSRYRRERQQAVEGDR